MHSIDEYTLAAFLDGTLTPARRQEVIAYLARNADARELLKMSYEALEAAEEPALFEQAEPAEPTPTRASVPDRQARPRPFPVPQLRSYAVAAVLVAGVLGAVLLLTPQAPPAEEPTAPRLRSAPSDVEPERVRLAVQVSAPSLRFRWTPVPDAYEYRLVVFDFQTATVIAKHTTKATQLDGDATFIEELRSQLDAEKIYALYVYARDVRNRDIVRSELTHFTLNE